MDELTWRDADGIDVFARRWLPDRPARAVVEIAHGASEHSGRYAPVAEVLRGRGFAVYAPDHRGHGRTAESTGPGRAGPRGFAGALDDLADLADRARADCGDVPLVLVGHSMGAVLAQAAITEPRYGGLAGLALSGTPGLPPAVDGTVALLEAEVAAGRGDEPLDVLGGFGDAGGRTRYDWLSRDPAVVDAYLADPWCGDDVPLTAGFVLELLRCGSRVADEAYAGQAPTGLPVLLLTGTADPVSEGAAAVRELEARYRAAGLDVRARYYEGARHEVLNETNRDEVVADLVAWLEERAPEA